MGSSEDPTKPATLLQLMRTDFEELVREYAGCTIYTHIHTCIHTFVNYMYICMCKLCVNVCIMCVCVYIYVCMYIYILFAHM